MRCSRYITQFSAQLKMADAIIITNTAHLWFSEERCNGQMLMAVLSHDAFQRSFLLITVAHMYNKMVVLVRQANYLVYTLCIVEMNLGTSLQKPPGFCLNYQQRSVISLGDISLELLVAIFHLRMKVIKKKIQVRDLKEGPDSIIWLPGSSHTRIGLFRWRSQLNSPASCLYYFIWIILGSCLL